MSSSLCLAHLGGHCLVPEHEFGDDGAFCVGFRVRESRGYTKHSTTILYRDSHSNIVALKAYYRLGTVKKSKQNHQI